MTVTRILVPLDGSTVAEAAVRTAIDFAGAPELILLRAAEAHPGPWGDPVQAEVDTVVKAEEYLKTAAARAFRRGSRAVETHVWYGPPAPAIIEAAHVLKADLIMMSTHGPSGLSRLLSGSVAESVLRGTTTPLLVVHGAESDPAPLAISCVRRRHFWCALQQRQVDVEFEEHWLGGVHRQMAVKRCSGFEPPTAITCRRQCLERAFRRQWPPALPEQADPSSSGGVTRPDRALEIT